MHDRSAAALDIGLVIALLLLVRSLVRLIGFESYAGPVATVLMVGVATVLLARRGSRWSGLGFTRPSSHWAVLGWALAMAVLSLLISPLAVTAVDHLYPLPPQDLSRFASLPGDTLRYLILLLPVAWGAAAFGEELLFRGFFMHRAATLFGGETTRARVLAALFQAVLFGLMHAYLGPRGMINASVVGVVSAWVFYRNGRNLWPLFIGHGLIDTLGITLLYLGIGLGH